MKSFLTLLRDSHHSENAWLETILEHKGSTFSWFKIKWYWLKSTHMEKCLVLDLWDTRMVEIFAVHEATLFWEISFIFYWIVIPTLLCRWLLWWILWPALAALTHTDLFLIFKVVLVSVLNSSTRATVVCALSSKHTPIGIVNGVFTG